MPTIRSSLAVACWMSTSSPGASSAWTTRCWRPSPPTRFGRAARQSRSGPAPWRELTRGCWRSRNPRSEPLAEVHHALALFEAERPMRLVAKGVVQQRIAAELGEAARTRPVLNRDDQRAAHARAAHRLVHPPPFHEG